MYSTRWVQTLMVVLSILIATQASWFHHGIDARQDSTDLSLPPLGGSNGPDDVTTPTPSSTPSDSPTPTDSPSSSEPPTTTPSDTPSSSSDSSSTAPTSSPTSDASTSDQSSPTASSNTGSITTPPTSTPTSSKSSTSESSDPNTNTPHGSHASTTPKPTTLTSTVFYTSTDSAGQTHIASSESVVTSTPGLSGGGGSGGSGSGISATTRSTIIGVTVGVGGAIILAAAGVLYWRLRNKRRSQEENEELISYGAGFGGPGTAEKSEASGPSASARSPFQSTLETYHAPTQTNAASNF